LATASLSDAKLSLVKNLTNLLHQPTIINLVFDQLAISLTCHFVKLMFCPLANSLSCHFINLSFCHFITALFCQIILSPCLFVKLAIYSTWYGSILVFHQPAISFTFSLICLPIYNLVLCPQAFSSACHFDDWLFN
jgi:hypothetical protein